MNPNSKAGPFIEEAKHSHITLTQTNNQALVGLVQRQSPLKMKKVVNIVIVTSIMVPIFMDLSFQFPITDFAHGPYNHCIGRFEVYFNPTHKDPFTPGKSDRFSYDFVIA